MEQKNNVLKYLVPVLAVLVLAESVVLISKFANKPITLLPKMVVNKEVVTEPKTMPVYDLVISSDNKNIKLGKTAEIEVKMRGSSARAMDSINVYLKFDPAAFEAKNLTFDKKLPAPTFSKISTTRSLVVANFLVTDPKGFSLTNGEEISLMKFSVTPKMTGSFDFEISTGDELKESVTMIVENTTGAVLPFSSNKLTVNVSR